MATPKQEYRAALRAIAGRFDNLEADTIERSAAMLRDLRDRLQLRLTATETISGVEAARLREMTANVDELVARYEAQLIGLSNGSLRESARLGALSVVEPLQAANVTFGFFEPTPAQINTLLDFSADLIRGIGRDVRRRINSEIRLAALGERSTVSAMQAINRQLGVADGTGVAYQGERILRTEMGRVFNLSNLSQQQVTARSVPGLQKQWLATGDGRTRIEHLIAHGQLVDIDEPFIVGGEELMYPLDPGASAEMTINCRCRMATVHPKIGPVGAPLDARVKREQKDRGVFQQAEFEKEIAAIRSRAPDIFADIRPPAGRAPRGKGEEYQQRRRIVSRIKTQMKYRNIAQQQLDQYRGQRGVRNRWRIDVATARVQELDKGIAAMLDIANDPDAEWSFKNEMVDGIIDYISAVRQASS